MKKILNYKKEIIVFFIVFIIGFSIAPTDGVNITHYNELKEQNEIKIKALKEKEEEINSLNPKIEEIKNEVNSLNKELEVKKQ